ncbi:MAG: hypothetical protein WBD80_22630, partial [Xanthobacteraceae bacterium]
SQSASATASIAARACTATVLRAKRRRIAFRAVLKQAYSADAFGLLRQQSTGHDAAAPPTRLMNSRRLMGRSPGKDHMPPHFGAMLVFCVTAKFCPRCRRWVNFDRVMMSEVSPLYLSSQPI